MIEFSGNNVIVWVLNKPLITVPSGIIALHTLLNNVPIIQPEKVINKINFTDLCLVPN